MIHTVSIRKEDVVRKWYIVNAENQVVGRLASEVAKILRGKHKPFYTPHVDTGDYGIMKNGPASPRERSLSIAWRKDGRRYTILRYRQTEIGHCACVADAWQWEDHR